MSTQTNTTPQITTAPATAPAVNWTVAPQTAQIAGQITPEQFAQIAGNRQARLLMDGCDSALGAYERANPAPAKEAAAAWRALIDALPADKQHLVRKYEDAHAGVWLGYCEAYLTLGLLVGSNPALMLSELFG